MAQKGEAEYLKRATACPKHGSTHMHRLITPDPGEYFAAFYTPSCCAGYELDRRNEERAMDKIPEFGSEYEQMEYHYNRLKAAEEARHGAMMFTMGVIEGLRQAVHAIKTEKDERQPSGKWPGMNTAIAAVEEAIAQAEETKHRAATLWGACGVRIENP